MNGASARFGSSIPSRPEQSSPGWAWARGDLAALAVATLVLGVVVRPALTSPVRGLGQYDASFTQIATEQLQDVLLHGADWRAAPLGLPLGYGTAQSDWQGAEAVLGLPLRLAAVDPSRAALLLSFFGLLATAWAGHRLARALLGPGPHTWVAGVLCSLTPLALVHLQHVNLVQHEGMILACLALGAGLELDRPRLAGLGAGLAVLSVHLGVYMGVHALAAASVVAGAAALARRGGRRTWGAVVLGAALAAGTVAPVLRFYSNADTYLNTEIREAEVLARSWDPATLFTQTREAPLDGALAFLPEQKDFPGNPGFLALGLGLVGLVVVRRRGWAWGAVVGVGALGLLLSLGPEIVIAGHDTGLPGPYAMLRRFPGMENLREPWRWHFLAWASNGLLAAAALQAATARLSRGARLSVTLAVLVVITLEIPRAHAARLDQWRQPDVFGVLSQLGLEGAFASHLPAKGKRLCGCTADSLLRAALLLRRPLVYSQYARRVPALDAVMDEVSAWPAQSAADGLASLGVVAMVEHPPVAQAVPRGWGCQAVADHRLCVISEAHTWLGLGKAPAYAKGEGSGAWMPALPVRDRDLRRFVP